MGKQDEDYFRTKAAQCRQLAAIAVGNELRRLIDELAEEFERRAEQTASRPERAAE